MSQPTQNFSHPPAFLYEEWDHIPEIVRPKIWQLIEEHIELDELKKRYRAQRTLARLLLLSIEDGQFWPSDADECYADVMSLMSVAESI